MSTYQILQFKATIENIISESDLPKEVIRMVLKEVMEKVNLDAYNEAMKELSEKEKEKEDGNID